MDGVTNEEMNGNVSGTSNGGERNDAENGTAIGAYREEDRVGTTLFDASSLTPYDPSQEAIFPPELMVSR